MADDQTRVVVRMPAHLVQALDKLGREAHRHRSELIRESVVRYVQERERQQLRDCLIQGYLEWGQLNAAWAEEEWDQTVLPRE